MNDEMEDVKIISMAELVQGARPLTSTASLYLPSTRWVPVSCSSLPNPITNTPTPTCSTALNPNPRVLTALNQPTIIVGTLNLPSYNVSSSSGCSCIQFFDGTYTVCCDILKFDAHVIGKKIHVYAWNFIPFKRGGGFLEIIKWGFQDSSDGLRKGLDQVNLVDSFPLVPSHSSTHGISSRARYRVYGVLESIGPFSVVPCTMLASDSKSTEDCNSSSSRNLLGFLVHVISCECRLCGSQVLLTNLSGLMANQNSHSFTKLVIVYFIDHASSWHSVITKLSGKHIMLSGLKRKLVFVGKEGSHIMYVTTDKSVLHVCNFSKKWLPRLKTDTKGRGKFGTYTGIIKGVYMQGMVVELDHDVWLLLTDQMLTPPHSLRVGAIISVRNVHFVDPKFSWTNILILGACVKTSIVVESFSPFETVCHVVLQSLSMLGKFIESLPFSARLWVLLLVSSIRKKFGSILSDKDVLGSKNEEGLAQMCATSQLPSSLFQTPHSAFMGLCRHDLYGCSRELHCGTLKLVIPMSNFICHCISTLMRMPKSENDSKLLTVYNQFRLLSCEPRSYGRSVRRIIPSEDVGCVLLGNLKIAPSTGRLQLVDATGGIDVIIPDLPLTWDPHELYEVMDYNIILDGIPRLVNHLSLHGSEALSCRTIFNCMYTQATREFNILIYVHFLWKDVKCRNFPLYPCISRKNDSEILEPGTYHMLRVSHKFPLLQKFSNNHMMSSTSSTFVEALLLPWILLLTGKNEILLPPKVSRGQVMEPSENCVSGNTNTEEQVSNKRQKFIKESRSSLLKDEFGNSICEPSAFSNSFSKSEENKNCVNLSSYQIPCLVTFRGIQNVNVLCSATLHSILSDVDMDGDSQPTARKFLLELSEMFLKYQLQIGDYYIIKHHKKDCFCTLKDANCGCSVKVLVDSGEHLWSLSFVSDEDLLYFKSAYSSKQDNLSPCIDEDLSKGQIEQLILWSDVNTSGIFSDVCLYLPANLKDLLKYNIMESEEGQGKPSTISEDCVSISPITGDAAAGRTPFSGSLSSCCLFPEGNLISLQGDVVHSHDVGSSFSNSCMSCAGLDAHQLKGFVGARSSLCIHLLVDCHIVKIFGSVSKHAFPIGFGPGVYATFHRVLDVRGQNEFMLLPVSFIAIKSIRVYDEPYSDRSSNLWLSKYAYDTSLHSFSSGLISELNQCLNHKQMWLRCRVVAVFVLVLERKATIFDVQTINNAPGPLFDIPLAGFVLDDGSSSCCCWANAERAATLLRLDEKLPERAFESSDWSFKWAGFNDNATSSATYHLGRILKKYRRISVKNYGSCFDFPYQDHVISVTSGDTLCSSDENQLKFIFFNACFGGLWKVVASVMNAEEVRQMEKKFLVEMDIMHTMQNIWAKEVCCISTLTEARSMIQQF